MLIFDPFCYRRYVLENKRVCNNLERALVTLMLYPIRIRLVTINVPFSCL